MSKKENDEEVLLDITKIKNFFKGKNKDKHSKSENGFDFKQIRKYAATYGIVLLILIPMFFAIWFRAYPAYLPITDTWAESNVYNYYRRNSKRDTRFPRQPDS